MSNKRANFRFGLFAEYIAMMMYRLQLYSIIEHRYRNFCGEIDIIAQRLDSLVFIEVKARSNNVDDVLCTEFQQTRIRNAAALYLAHHTRYNDYNLRFDLVLVRPYRWPTVIKNAW